MEKPRILVFTTSYYPLESGAEIATREVISRLQDQYEFVILTHRFRRDLLREEMVGGARVMRLGFGTALDRYFLFPFLAFLRAYHLSAKGPILLWGIMVTYATYGAYFLKFFRPWIPFILTLQEGDEEWRIKFSKKFGLTGFSWRIMLKRSDAVVAISSFLEACARQSGFGGETSVIPNGVDIERFSRARNPEAPECARGKFFVLTTSRLEKKNGVDTLIRAIAIVKKEHREIHCHIIGHGSEKKKLSALVAKLGLAGEVEFTGSVAYAEIPKLIQSASLFVRLSRSEGLGSSFIEALAAGIPVVGTAVGGIPDIIKSGKTGFLVGPDNPADAARAILSIIKNPQSAKKTAEGGNALVKEKFLWSGVAHAYAACFTAAFAKQPRVLVATGLFPPQIGGPATYSKTLFNELPRRGIPVTVLPFSSVRHLPSGIRHAAYFKKLCVLARTHDIIFAQDPVSVGLPSAVAALLKRKRFAIKIVGDWAWEQGVQRFGVKDLLDDFLGKRYGVRIALLRALERFSAGQASRIIVPSRYLKGVVERWGLPEDRIVVVANATEECETRIVRADARAKLRLQGTVLLSAGRLVPWKGFAALIELLSRLQRRIPDIRLVIAGSGSDKERLSALVEQHHVSGSVVFTGSISHEELELYFRACDIFVLNTGYEGFSHMVLEAMSCGIPVLTTMAGGNPEIIEHRKTGLLVGYNNQDALVAEIVELIENKDFREKLVNHAHARAREFTKEKMIEQTITALHSL